MPIEVEVKETLEEIRNKLITECRQEPGNERAGYVNGVLDTYNAIKKWINRKEENEYHHSLE